ncbi:flagellar filament capping protein FliD [Stenotrophomonas sp.]|uniref:flagellar filament capping protein FliD n=1 Tax=Stenotrophomonas sp. TaxID=69392 RepID=UPI002D375DEC|nr:flagellar filament capping protein FliD [Stenotrophomonas sp.]HYQ23324.1 flagellar filament capping protein FliD [Stenotrophomonas sp.]
MALSTVGSGLDVTTIVAQLVAAERKPTETRINTAGTAATAKLSALGSIKSSLTSLQTALETFSKSASRPTFKATPAENAGFTAAIATDATTGKTLATAGTHNIEVVSLSQNQKLTSAAFSKDTHIGTGTLTVAYGDKTLSIEVSDKGTLSDIASAINSAAGGKGVSASVITADDGQHLVLNAVDSGTKGAITLSTTGGNGGLDQLTWDGTSGGLTQTVEPTDAVVKVDGFTRTSSSNTIADIIPGVTLTVTKADAGTTKTLTVAQDNTPMKTNLQAFIAAYNATSSMLKSASAYDATTETASVLTGDSMVRGLQQQLRGQMSANVNQLKALGVTIGKDGSLAFDSATFDKAMAADPSSADALFGEKGTLTTSMQTMLKSQLDSTQGTLTQRTTSLNKQIKTLEKELDDLDARMEKVSARYTAQFTAMDTLVAQMQSTSDYLTQQLASLQSKTSK